MKEPDVTLTNFLLTLQCWLFALILVSDFSASDPGLIIAGIFFLVGLSALSGGVVHGFSHRFNFPFLKTLWMVTLLSVVLTSALMWALAGSVLSLQPLYVLAAVTLVANLVAALIRPVFLVAIISYVPALLCLLVSFAVEWKNGEIGSGLVCVGLLISLAAPIVQVAKLNLHPKYLTFNAFYHLIQFVSLMFLYEGFKSWLQVTVGLEGL